MRVWLDDERDPKDPFIQSRFGSRGDEIWVKNTPAAIALLETGKVTYISLDHDLGSGIVTGDAVSDWIEKHAENGTLPALEWDVHTMNMVGKKKMVAALLNANKFWGSEAHE